MYVGVVVIEEKDWGEFDWTDYFLVNRVKGKWIIAAKSFAGRPRKA